MPHVNLAVAAVVLSLTASAMLVFAAVKSVLYGRTGRLLLFVAVDWAVSGVLWAMQGQYALSATYGVFSCLFTVLGVRVVRRAPRSDTTSGGPAQPQIERPDFNK